MLSVSTTRLQFRLTRSKNFKTMPRGKAHRKGPAQKKPPLTHFLCVPLITADSVPQLEASLDKFRADVAPSPPATGLRPGSPLQDAAERTNEATPSPIHPKAIRPVGVLHCTLGVMSLNEAKLASATDLLQSLDIASLLSTPSIDESPLKVSLTGLESMHDPKKTSILYTAPHDFSERLYPLCLALQTRFREAGFLVPDDRPLKLHATIVNTIYAKRRGNAPSKANLGFSHDSSVGLQAAPDAGSSSQQLEAGDDDRASGHGPNANAPLKFDAQDALERYRDFVWAENIVLDRVAICEMGAKKRFGDDGEVVGEEYLEVASVKLPAG